MPINVHLVKAMVFPLTMYGYESWTIKKAENQRTDVFELWCWRRLLESLLDSKANQSILKEISSEYSLEGLMLILKLQYWWEELSLRKSPWTSKDWRWKTGTTEDEIVGWYYQLDGHEFEWTLGVGDGQVNLVWFSPWGHNEWDMTEWQNWSELRDSLLFQNSTIQTFKKPKILF